MFLIASKNKGLSDLCVCVCVYIQLLVTPGTVACQGPLSTEFSRQAYWSGLVFLSPGNLSHHRSNLRLLHWQADSLPPVPPWPRFSSVTQSCLTLCDPTGLPVHHQLPELAQTHVYRVDDAIQPYRPLSSPSPPAFNLPQHQGRF